MSRFKPALHRGEILFPIGEPGACGLAVLVPASEAECGNILQRRDRLFVKIDRPYLERCRKRSLRLSGPRTTIAVNFIGVEAQLAQCGLQPLYEHDFLFADSVDPGLFFACSGALLVAIQAFLRLLAPTFRLIMHVLLNDPSHQIDEATDILCGDRRLRKDKRGRVQDERSSKSNGHEIPPAPQISRNVI
ncbi:MAG: hypothetical protein R3D70_03285 [Rhizobiaceae bacterium]